jgi:hypothetical protein
MMLSPVKVIAAGALAIAIGSVAFVARPIDQPDVAPAAQGEPAAPAWITGTMEPVDGTCSETGFSSDGGVSRHSYECNELWSSSDPRFTGDASRLWTEDSYQTDEGSIAVGMESSILRNEGGDWVCPVGYLAKGSDPMTQEDLTASDTVTCVGSGDYEGLSAVLVSRRPDPESFALEFIGLIFSGDLPPLPEAPAAE